MHDANIFGGLLLILHNIGCSKIEMFSVDDVLSMSLLYRPLCLYRAWGHRKNICCIEIFGNSFRFQAKEMILASNSTTNPNHNHICTSAFADLSILFEKYIFVSSKSHL